MSASLITPSTGNTLMSKPIVKNKSSDHLGYKVLKVFSSIDIIPTTIEIYTERVAYTKRINFLQGEIAKDGRIVNIEQILDRIDLAKDTPASLTQKLFGMKKPEEPNSDWILARRTTCKLLEIKTLKTETIDSIQEKLLRKNTLAAYHHGCLIHGVNLRQFEKWLHLKTINYDTLSKRKAELVYATFSPEQKAEIASLKS